MSTPSKMQTVTVHNPVCPTGADPWVIRHNGVYYYCYSGGQSVWVSAVPSLADLGKGAAKQVFSAPPHTAYSAEYWAPELHYLQGEWYIYVAADDGHNETHRMYVLKGTSQDPTDPFEWVGQITDPTDKWAIDGTVLTVNGTLYFVWSGWEGDVNVVQHLYIARMQDPQTIDSPRVLLSSPVYPWEQIGRPLINEGPTALYHGDRVFLVYSASGSWTDDYCLGLITLTGEDPVDPACWTKCDRPLFQKRDGVAYGPGHASFTEADDGSTVMVYHANLAAGTSWGGRSVWLHPLAFDAEGYPCPDHPAREVTLPLAAEPAPDAPAVT